VVENGRTKVGRDSSGMSPLRQNVGAYIFIPVTNALEGSVNRELTRLAFAGDFNPVHDYSELAPH
jgi:hypothetical protein